MRENGRLCFLLLFVLLTFHSPEKPVVVPVRSFDVYFSAPAIGPPNALVAERVRKLSKELEPLLSRYPSVRRSWVEALVTHESGGDPLAISPTGCAGLGAICYRQFTYPVMVNCCQALTGGIYDTCSEERRTGQFLCQPKNDPRFDTRYSLRFIARRLSSLIDEMQVESVNSPNVGLVLAAAYNAGRQSFLVRRRDLSSASAYLGNLDLEREPIYRAWSDEDFARKIVEIYDYLSWWENLVAFWEGTPPSERQTGAPFVGLSFRSGHRLGIRYVDEVPSHLKQIDLMRLRFGEYNASKGWYESTGHRSNGPIAKGT